MSKSSGEFLRLQLLIDKGYHPLAYRLMCLQAHYRSELEFSWEGLGAALTRLKRLVMGMERVDDKLSKIEVCKDSLLPYHVVVEDPRLIDLEIKFDRAISDDLNTAIALTLLEDALSLKNTDAKEMLNLVERMDDVLGLGLTDPDLFRAELRIRPVAAQITQPEIDAILAARKEARAAKDFATSDKLRDELTAKGVEVMDGDPLGWDWKLGE